MFARSKPQPVDSIIVLRREHRQMLVHFLSQDVVSNLFALSWLENYGVVPRRAGVFHFAGAFNRLGSLEAVALVISDRLILFESIDTQYIERFARRYAGLGTHFHHIVSKKQWVDSFWPAYRKAAQGTLGVRARLHSPQCMYALNHEAALALDGHPRFEPTPLRRAQMSDLDAVFFASASMHKEETFEDPLVDDPDKFRRHVRHRIEMNRTFVWFDNNRLLFKVDISAQSCHGAQLSGVFTQPHVRNQGIATRAIADVCRILTTQGMPCVTLYVNEGNMAARRVYERIGFSYHAQYKTLFVHHE